MTYLPESMVIWVHGTVFRIRFETDNARDNFIRAVDFSEDGPLPAYDSPSSLVFIRPSSVDAYRVGS